MNILTEIINDIYRTGVWPQDFFKVTMIALKKKPQAKKCSDHQTISLISHVGKILARNLNRRLEKKAEEIVGEEQFGFSRGKDTRDAIGMMRIISERVLDVIEDICACLTDWKKAFD